MYILFLYFRSSTIFIANVDAKTTPMDLWIASVPQGWFSLKTVAGDIDYVFLNVRHTIISKSVLSAGSVDRALAL